MTCLEDFIRAIAAAPQDTTLRAVFADWLEERGDPRAADVRRTLDRRPWYSGAWSDYVWSLNDTCTLPKPLFDSMWRIVPEDKKGSASGGLNVWAKSDAWPLFGRAFALWFGVEL